MLVITCHSPGTVVCLFPLQPLVQSHFCISPTLFPVQSCGFSTALFLAVAHSDVVKSTLCCRQLLSLSYHWFCSAPQELCHVLTGNSILNFNVIVTV